MPVDVDDLILLFRRLSEQKETKAASKRFSLLAGAGGLIGVLLGGPVGLCVGAMLGDYFSDEHLKPVPQILLELPPDEKKKL